MTTTIIYTDDGVKLKVEHHGSGYHGDDNDTIRRVVLRLHCISVSYFPVDSIVTYIIPIPLTT